MHDKIIDILFDQQDVTWQNMIFEAVKKEEMDPWDVDISSLAKRFLEMVKQLKEMDFKISGKIILAAAILLRLKSNKLLTDDLGELDRLIAMSEQTEEEFYDELEHQYLEKGRIVTDEEKFKLVPRTPQPRKRKVSVFDLVEALQQALDVKKRRVIRHAEWEQSTMTIPVKQRDITDMIGKIYESIMVYFMEKKSQKMQFSQLVPSNSREDKVYTFIPLLHLTNQLRVSLEQEYHLAEIDIYMPKDKVITQDSIRLDIEEIKKAYRISEEKEGSQDIFAKKEENDNKDVNDKKEGKDNKVTSAKNIKSKKSRIKSKANAAAQLDDSDTRAEPQVHEDNEYIAIANTDAKEESLSEKNIETEKIEKHI